MGRPHAAECEGFFLRTILQASGLFDVSEIGYHNISTHPTGHERPSDHRTRRRGISRPRSSDSEAHSREPESRLPKTSGLELWSWAGLMQRSARVSSFERSCKRLVFSTFPRSVTIIFRHTPLVMKGQVIIVHVVEVFRGRGRQTLKPIPVSLNLACRKHLGWNSGHGPASCSGVRGFLPSNDLASVWSFRRFRDRLP